MNKIYKILVCVLLALFFISCDNFLDRIDKTVADNETYWTNEAALKYYDRAFYPYFFTGYNTGGSTPYSPMGGYYFSDDMVTNNKNQTDFTLAVSTGSIGSTEDGVNDSYATQFAGPDWNFTWIRKANVMQDRIINRMKNILGSSYDHWLALARFYRALEYARMVNVYGDVPYYDREIATNEVTLLYKNRDSRDDIMDAVFTDFETALADIKVGTSKTELHRYSVAGVVSRWALIEGSWQKYHLNNTARAEKFFDLAVRAAEVVISSNKYKIDSEYRNIFTSESLSSNNEVILARDYNMNLSSNTVGHAVATRCNMTEVQTTGPTLDFLKAFLCIDGQPYDKTSIANGGKFDITNMIKTRDPRFEAMFYSKPTPKATASYFYIAKFIPREALDYVSVNGSPADKYTKAINVTSAPVVRYAEVLLNWIEAKRELELLGTGVAVSQTDIDVSINALRDRPINSVAASMGVSKIDPLQLTAIPNDPNRDSDVEPLLWEIRRERRIELFQEFPRLVDLRRWKKLEYMDTDANRDLMLGGWVDFPTELPEVISNNSAIRVVDINGNIHVYDSEINNGSLMVGFWYSPTREYGRIPFLTDLQTQNVYLRPLGEGDIYSYTKLGYKLSQTKGWPQ